MKSFFKKALVTSAIGLALGFAASSASAVVVGGVNFGNAGAFSHIETTTVAETLVNNNGQTLTGYGQINTVNGSNNYAGSNLLYFTFTNYISNDFGPTGVDFTGGVINVYLGATFNLLNQSSASNLALIAGLTPWAQFVGHRINAANDTLHATGSVSGATINFTGGGLLDVNSGFGLASVFSYLNANTISDTLGGFADIAVTTSGNNLVLNPFDNTTGCATGQAAPGTWCIAGSADLRGNTVIPEPASMALIGLGLLGMGGVLRRRNKA